MLSLYLNPMLPFELRFHMIIINSYYTKSKCLQKQSPWNPCLGMFLPCNNFKHFVTGKLTNFWKQDGYTILEKSSFLKYRQGKSK